MPDFKTIANFRKDNGPEIRNTCRQFVALCQRLGFFSEALAAIDDSKFKAVNNRNRNSPKPNCSGGWQKLKPALAVT